MTFVHKREPSLNKISSKRLLQMNKTNKMEPKMVYFQSKMKGLLITTLLIGVI